MSLKDIKRFYAVKEGRECNVIVDTWLKCKKLVDGHKNARFKGFHYRDEAEAWLKEVEKPKKKFHGKRKNGALYGITQKTVRTTPEYDTTEPLYSGESPPWDL